MAATASIAEDEASAPVAPLDRAGPALPGLPLRLRASEASVTWAGGYRRQ